MANINQFGQVIGAAVPNWQARVIPSQATMQGRYCRLEAVNINTHGESLFSALLFDNPGDLWTYLPSGPFTEYEEFAHWLVGAMTIRQYFVIMDQATNQPLGLASYMNINPEQGSVEVGSLQFSKLLQKTRIATEAMYLMMQRVFDELGYRRYEWKCDALNEASWKAAERLGFKLEGVFRQSHVIKGCNRDTAYFSIIDSEWPALKAKFIKWLEPSNFDSHGKQIQRLQDIL